MRYFFKAGVASVFRYLILFGLLAGCMTAKDQNSLDIENPVSFEVTEGTNFAAALSPDGQLIAIDLQGRLWVMPAKGGEAKPITKLLDEARRPAWSPDGEWIAFQYYVEHWHVWVVRKDGSDMRQVTFGPYDDREPQWSPDGSKLVFSSDRGGNYDLWEVDSSDGELTQLTSGEIEEFHPVYSPDGQKLAYITEKGGNRSALVIRGVEGEPTELLTRKTALATPQWSSDSSRIAYHTWDWGVGLENLHVVDVNTRVSSQITLEEEDVFPTGVSWVSSNELLYTADGQIKVRKIDAGENRTIPFSATLTVAKREDYPKRDYDFTSSLARPVKGIMRPMVSPNGDQIAFTALSDLWLLDIGDPNPRRLTEDPYLDVDPAWSPDGSKLAYLSDSRGTGTMDLYIRDMRTGAEQRITETEDDLRQPAWSPDGRRLAVFMRDANDWHAANLYLVDSDNGKMELIYEGVFLPSAPNWSADSKSINFMALKPSSKRYRKGVNAFFRVSLVTGEGEFTSPDPQRSISARSQFGPIISPDGHQLAYLHDGILWTVEISSDGKFLQSPRQLTRVYSSYPSWSGDSKSIVYLEIDKFKSIDVASGEITDIPLNLNWQRNISSGRKVVQAGKVFDAVSPDYLTDVDIVIDGNVISEIVPRRDDWRGVEIIDARDKTVVPGLFQMHIHHFVTDGEKPGRTWLSFGITSVREPGAEPYEALERKESWASGSRIGPRQFYSIILEGSRLYYWMNTSVVANAQFDMEMERALKLDYDFIKLYERMPDAMQKRIIKFAHANGLMVASHEIYPAATFGIDVVEHMGTEDRMRIADRESNDGVVYDDVIQIMAKSDTYIMPTAAGRAPSAAFIYQLDKNPEILDLPQVKAFTPKYLRASKYLMDYLHSYYGGRGEKYALNEQASIARMEKNGVLIGTGTDGGPVSYGYPLILEMKYFADSGMGNYKALKSATIDSAKATGVDQYLGSIERGKLADLVIIDGDPLTEILDLYNVETVIKDGITYGLEELLKSP